MGRWAGAGAVAVLLLVAGCGGGGGDGAVVEPRETTTSTVAVTVPATRIASPVDQLVGVGDAEQVVVVTAEVSGARTATLTAYERVPAGWREVFGPLDADIGTNGFAPPGEKREGDGHTPSGAYDFGFAFGVLADPGVHVEYRRITGPSIVWDDDPTSRRYNEWVDTATETAGSDPEPMFNQPAYDYGAVIAYNPERTPGLGSAIFLHVSKGGPTAGCVAIARDDLVEILRWLDPVKRPRIVMGTRDAITATSPPTPSTPAATAAGAPHPVEVVHATVEDPSRPTGARGPTPASPRRTLPVTVYVPQVAGRFPLLVFAHGYDIAAADYEPLLHRLAATGFVVVAPDFPLSSRAFPGPPTQADIDEQARDVAFLVDQLLDDRASGAWSGRVAAGEAGVVGHSDGGNTVARAASNSCCFTSRIGAGAVLSGDPGTSGGDWGVAGAPPLLFLQGTDDPINPWSFTQRLYDAAASPKLLVAIDGGDHLEPYVAEPDAIVALLATFFRAHLAGDANAAARVPKMSEAGDLRLVAAS